MNDIFLVKRDTGYDLRSNRIEDFESMNIHTVHTGEDSLRFLVCKIWKLIPWEIKEAESVDKFKFKIRKWKPVKCPCRLCKIFIQRIGYIDREL